MLTQQSCVLSLPALHHSPYSLVALSPWGCMCSAPICPTLSLSDSKCKDFFPSYINIISILMNFLASFSPLALASCKKN